jgi:hypothetical protein
MSRAMLPLHTAAAAGAFMATNPAKVIDEM